MIKYIVISGIDGSGKTSVLEDLDKHLRAEGKSTHYIWMRYNHYFVKLLNAMARVLKLSVKKETPMGTIWQHQYYKSQLFFKVYIFFSYIDNRLALRKIRRVAKENYDYLLCDRWVNDILIDIGAEFRQLDLLNTKWYDRFQGLLPVGAQQFIITRSKESIIACRLENKVNPDFEARYALYEKLALKKEVTSVDNSNTIANSVAQIIQQL